MSETSEVEALAKVWHEAIEKGADERGVMMGLPIAALEAVARTVRAQDAARGGTLTAKQIATICRVDSRSEVLAYLAAQGRTIATLTERYERADRALSRAGFTYVPGAMEWRPPLGPSAAQLLERIDAAESALATLRQKVGEAARALECGEERGKVESMLLDALEATPSEHPDTATLRGVRERAKDAEKVACVWLGIPGFKGSGLPPSHRASLRANAGRAVSYLLGDSGPGGGGETVEMMRDSVLGTAPPLKLTTTPDVAASEASPITPELVAAARNAVGLPPLGTTASDATPKPTPEEDWRTVERGIRHDESCPVVFSHCNCGKDDALDALARLKEAPRRAAEAMREKAADWVDRALKRGEVADTGWVEELKTIALPL